MSRRFWPTTMTPACSGPMTGWKCACTSCRVGFTIAPYEIKSFLIKLA